MRKQITLTKIVFASSWHSVLHIGFSKTHLLALRTRSISRSLVIKETKLNKKPKVPESTKHKKEETITKKSKEETTTKKKSEETTTQNSKETTSQTSEMQTTANLAE